MLCEVITCSRSTSVTSVISTNQMHQNAPRGLYARTLYNGRTQHSQEFFFTYLCLDKMVIENLKFCCSVVAVFYHARRFNIFLCNIVIGRRHSTLTVESLINTS